MQKIIFYNWKNSKIPKVPSSGTAEYMLFSLSDPKNKDMTFLVYILFTFVYFHLSKMQKLIGLCNSYN